MRYALMIFALLAAPALAEGLRSTDAQLDQAGMGSLLSGKVVTFYDGSKSSYAPDGAYRYTYTDDGPAWIGRYTFSDDSRVCVTFENGMSRCDMIVMDADRAVLITDDGTRFPFRNLTVYQR